MSQSRSSAATIACVPFWYWYPDDPYKDYEFRLAEMRDPRYAALRSNLERLHKACDGELTGDGAYFALGVEQQAVCLAWAHPRKEGTRPGVEIKALVLNRGDIVSHGPARVIGAVLRLLGSDDFDRLPQNANVELDLSNALEIVIVPSVEQQLAKGQMATGNLASAKDVQGAFLAAIQQATTNPVWRSSDLTIAVGVGPSFPMVKEYSYAVVRKASAKSEAPGRAAVGGSRSSGSLEDVLRQLDAGALTSKAVGTAWDAVVAVADESERLAKTREGSGKIAVSSHERQTLYDKVGRAERALRRAKESGASGISFERAEQELRFWRDSFFPTLAETPGRNPKPSSSSGIRLKLPETIGAVTVLLALVGAAVFFGMRGCAPDAPEKPAAKGGTAAKDAPAPSDETALGDLLDTADRALNGKRNDAAALLATTALELRLRDLARGEKGVDAKSTDLGKLNGALLKAGVYDEATGKTIDGWIVRRSEALAGKLAGAKTQDLVDMLSDIRVFVQSPPAG